MKKSFYELYLERQQVQNNQIEDNPMIRSPNGLKMRLSYYIGQLIKILVIIVISVLAGIGAISIMNNNLRSQILELLSIQSSLFFVE